jgi:hypothetical protein
MKNQPRIKENTVKNILNPKIQTRAAHNTSQITFAKFNTIFNGAAEAVESI